MKYFDDGRCLSRSEKVNVCEHAVKMVPRESFEKVPPQGVRDRKGEKNGEKIEWKPCEVNTKAVSSLFNPPETALVSMSDSSFLSPLLSPPLSPRP